MTTDSLTRTIAVDAPARLHLGFLDLNGDLGRTFGSIGLAVDQPSTRLTLAPATVDSITGLEQARARRAIDALRHQFEIVGRYHLHIDAAIPAHTGLGSGTQLSIAIATALAKLEGIADSPRVLGEKLNRGARSAIGIGAFERGGFIVDGGRGALDAAPPILVQHDFPPEWRAILVFDPNDVGVHGNTETTAFDRLPPLPASSVGEVCRLVLMRLLPGLVERDLPSFGAALTEIQEIVGRHFAPAQGGGIWTSDAVCDITTALKAAGAHGIGQSSWGPTGFAFADSQLAAERLYHSLVEDAKARGVTLQIVKGRNAGADVAFAR